MNSRLMIYVAIAAVFSFNWNAAEAVPGSRTRVSRRAKASTKRPLTNPRVKNKLDKNNNGLVSKREVKRAQAKNKKPVLSPKAKAKLDKNNNGKVSKKELARARRVRKTRGKPPVKAKRQARRSSVVSRFDANGDGRLNRAERKAWFRARKAQRQQNKASGTATP